MFRPPPIPSTASARCPSCSPIWPSCILVEQGKIDLDAPVSGYVPEFAPKNPYKADITLRQLMSHRSGLVREPPAGHYFDPAPPSLEDVVRSLAATSLVFEPGKRTKYSNAAVTVVGAVIEKVAKEPFAARSTAPCSARWACQARASSPSPELSARLAHGMMWTYDGQTVATPSSCWAPDRRETLFLPCVDLGHFLSFLFAEGASPTAQADQARDAASR